MANTNEKEVTLTFTGAVKMEIKTSLAKALDVARMLTGDMQSPIAPAPTTSTPIPGASSTTKLGGSPLEVLKNTGAKTYPQQITALAYYTTERNKTEVFDPKEIQIILRRLGTYPQNFWRDLRHATHALGYLNEEAPNQYRVTDTGRENLFNKFEGAIEGLPRRRKSRNRKSKP